MPKRLVRGVIKAVAGIAVVVFLLTRFTTNTGVLPFVGSIVALLICFGLLKPLDGALALGPVTRSCNAPGSEC